MLQRRFWMSSGTLLRRLGSARICDSEVLFEGRFHSSIGRAGETMLDGRLAEDFKPPMPRTGDGTLGGSNAAADDDLRFASDTVSFAKMEVRNR